MTGVQTCALDRKSTRLNSSHTIISYAVFCLKKKRHYSCLSNTYLFFRHHATRHIATTTPQIQEAPGKHKAGKAGADVGNVLFFKGWAAPGVQPYYPPARFSE